MILRLLFQEFRVGLKLSIVFLKLYLFLSYGMWSGTYSLCKHSVEEEKEVRATSCHWSYKSLVKTDEPDGANIMRMQMENGKPLH